MPVKGNYARIFEEEYRRAREASGLPDAVQGGGSDIATPRKSTTAISRSTRRARWTDTAENNQGNRDNAERAYNLIMKDKEKLLSFETQAQVHLLPLGPAEGWDNPNVFQICALREMGPSASAARPSAAACASASTSRASACAASRSTR